MKTLSESAILPFSGAGGITQKVNMLGMQDREAWPAFTVHAWTGQRSPRGGWGVMDGRGGRRQP